jgi:GLPGLI family protein
MMDRIGINFIIISNNLKGMISRFIIILLFISLSLQGQNDKGVITYNRKEMWVNIMSKLPFMSKEEIQKEMAIWGKQQGNWEDLYLLEFDTKATMYKSKPQEENLGYYWRKDEVFYYRDLTVKRFTDKVTLGDKDYIIKGDLTRTKWKILNELRDIQGFICMKAQTSHPIYGTPVIAWYTDKIPVAGGPEGFGGLPGMILQLEFNNDDVIIEATKVTFAADQKDIVLPSKVKGKASTFLAFADSKNKFIKQQLEGRRNPYWNTRY